MRAIAFALTFMLAGCAGPIETRVSSIGQTGIVPAKIQLDSDISGTGAQAYALVAEALANKGFSAGEPSDYSLHVSVSDRPANLSLNAGKDVLAPVTGKEQICATREYRLGVTLTRITDGTVAYRAHAAEFHCKHTLQQALPFLVEAAAKDLGQPQGSYAVKRPRRIPQATPATSG